MPILIGQLPHPPWTHPHIQQIPLSEIQPLLPDLNNLNVNTWKWRYNVQKGEWKNTSIWTNACKKYTNRKELRSSYTKRELVTKPHKNMPRQWLLSCCSWKFLLKKIPSSWTNKRWRVTAKSLPKNEIQETVAKNPSTVGNCWVGSNLNRTYHRREVLSTCCCAEASSCGTAVVTAASLNSSSCIILAHAPIPNLASISIRWIFIFATAFCKFAWVNVKDRVKKMQLQVITKCKTYFILVQPRKMSSNWVCKFDFFVLLRWKRLTSQNSVLHLRLHRNRLLDKSLSSTRLLPCTNHIDLCAWRENKVYQERWQKVSN